MGRCYRHLAAVGTATIGTTGSDVILHGIVLGTKATSAVITLKESTTGGVTIAVIDGATAPGFFPFWGLRLPNGLFVDLAGGNADITVIYE